MKKIYISSLVLVLLLFTACTEFLEPRQDNSLTRDQILADPSYAEGLLLNGYLDMPNGYSFNEVATDDAMNNINGANLARMATGEWSASFNPVGVWGNRFETIYYLNLFLDVYQEVDWAPLAGEDVAQLHRNRLEGEAHGLRAWHMFELLQAHSGIGTNGNLLGFPIITSPITPEDNLELPRNTYDECVSQIVSDLEIAISRLPNQYTDGGPSDSVVTYGKRWTNRMTRRAAQALKSRVLLHAASPAFNGTEADWDEAAKAAGEMLQDMGGISAISPNGIEFYKDANRDDPEILWRREFFTTNNWESNNFPPSFSGKAQTNPSQNLVDAFPMDNGYPIDNPNSNFDPNDPYSNRDPRLEKYIVFDGSIFKGAPISTAIGAPDGINSNQEVITTRTGYYVRKLLDESVSVVPGATTSTNHFYTLFRLTEVFLNYAEAANEAYGPDGDPNGYGFTARDVISVIRERAGINQPDGYLSSISNQDDMRALIRNERRIELCFEGYRFWDLRRWDNDLTEAVQGAFITAGSPNSYEIRDVESRSYQSFMKYGPIPFNETLKYDIVQNQGW